MHVVNYTATLATAQSRFAALGFLLSIAHLVACVTDSSSTTTPDPGSSAAPTPHASTSPTPSGTSPTSLTALFRPISAVPGSTTAILLITARDASGAPLPGESVHITGNGNITVTPSTGVTDANGMLVAAVASSQPGAVDVVVTLDGLSRHASTFFAKPCPGSHLTLHQNFLLPSPVFGSAGDLNGDGFVDLITVTNANTLVVLLNDATGTFHVGAQIANPNGISINSHSVSDFDGDGKVDVLASAGNGQDPNHFYLAFYAGSGDGTFKTPKTLNLGAPIFYWNIQDLDSDGAPDIVYSAIGGGATQAWFNAGDATFPKSAMVTLSTNSNASQPGFGDVNGDGWLDVITGDPAVSGNLTLYLSSGHRQYQPAVNIPTKPTVDANGVSSIASASTLAIGDLTGRGRIDIVTPSWLLASFDVYSQQVDGSFAWAATYPSPMPYMTYPALGDFNGDGHLDIILGDTDLLLFTNDGHGAFSTNDAIPIGSFAAARPIVADFNGDGALDAAVASNNNFAIVLNACQ